MLSVVVALLQTFHTLFRSRAALHLEILALRHQLHVLQRSRPRHIRLTRPDRWLWVWLSHVWAGWRTAAVLVKPATVVAWHRRGFRLFWTWKCRRRAGRPCTPHELRMLIRTTSEANPLWGAPRIHGELLKLGIDVSQSTVAKYMPRRKGPPSPTWRTFVANHASQIVAADFFVVPTVTYRLPFVLVLLAHERRRLVHVAAHRSSDGGLERAATPRGVSSRRSPAISPSRSRRRLRSRRTNGRQYGHQRDLDRAAIPMAERLRRTRHRLHST